MSSVPKVPYSVADKRYYETLDRYVADEEAFLAPVQDQLPDHWRVVRQGVWFHVVPLEKALAPQGWKIHLSATQENAPEILRRVLPIAFARTAPFKFALDRRILSIITGKNWHRGSAGKFVTLYPDDDRHFRELIEEVHEATSDLAGPYILSDRRFRDSRIVHYRYGGLAPIKSLSFKGEQTPVIKSPDGDEVRDERNAYFFLPPWVQNPFPEDEAEEIAEGTENTLKDGRYLVETALTFSNSGGVYLARDRETDETVVIKEARPLVNETPHGLDSVALLRKEFRLLKILEATGIAPKPVDFFQDWEHHYLVEEYLGDAPALRSFAASVERNILLFTRVTKEDVEAYWAEYLRIFGRLAEMLERLHAHGIAFMDLSLNNVLVLEGGQDLRLIDFEGAFEPESDSPPYLFTPGFISPGDLGRQAYTLKSDYWGFGALMFAYLMPVNSMLNYCPEIFIRIGRSVCEDFGIPEELVDILEGLFDENTDNRPKPTEAVSRLAAIEIEPEPELQGRPDLDEAVAKALEGTLEHLLSVPSYDRTDRLFPADPKVFVTNPLSLGYGACGVAYTLQKLTGGVPGEVLEWIGSRIREAEAKDYSPGLYVGLSGIAWCLWEIGMHDEALAIIRNAAQRPEDDCSDLFYGTAGRGMAQLKLFLETGDQEWLERSASAGDLLLERARDEEGDLLYWPNEDEEIPLGLGHGASGIALFLLYLFLATGEERYLRAGRRGLDFDLAEAVTTPQGALTWRMRRNPTATMLPYLRYGSAGIGSALLRYYWLLGEEEDRTILEGLYPDISRKYAIFPGRFIGLTGMGELLLDFAGTDGWRERADQSLRKLITGLLFFQVEVEEGVAFPGYELLRLSCDHGTGSAGIGLFLHRYRNRRPADFLLDRLFDNRASVQSESGATVHGKLDGAEPVKARPVEANVEIASP